MTDSEALVRSLEGRLRPLEIAASRAWWDASTAAGPDSERRRADADLALSDALADRDAFRALRDALAAVPPGGMLGRELLLLEHAHVPHQVAADLRRRIVELQAAVESTFARHRGEVAGAPVDDNAIASILRSSDDVGERRAAWEAAKTVGAVVDGDVRELVRLRNDAAREVGFPDHFALALATSELDETRLFATLDEVDRLTRAPFREWKAQLDAALAERFSCTPSELRPWHYDDPFFQSPPVAAAVDLDPFFEHADLAALVARTYDGLGLDVSGIVGRSDLFPREGKNQHAFCLDVDREGDVRVLANVTPNEQWAETMLHEFGHGVYFLEVDGGLPWLLRTMHMLTTEGIAMLGGRLVRDPDWLRTVAGVPAGDVDALAARLHDAQRGALLVFARWVLVMTHFERGLYRDPHADHDERWWDLVERYQEVRRPDGRRAPDWAAKVHFAVAPVYYHNYLYGEMFASQVHAAVRDECGGVVGRRAAGAYLRDRVFRPGASVRWDHLVERATGRPLSPACFVRDLAS